MGAGLDPAGSFSVSCNVSWRAFLALPERRAGLQVIHQELGRLERRLAVLRGRQHKHDVFAGRDAAETVNDGQPVQRPARHRFFGMAHDLGLRHPGIVFQGQRRDVVTALAAAADAGKCHHRADVGPAMGQACNFARDVEIGFLDANGDDRGHGLLVFV